MEKEFKFDVGDAVRLPGNHVGTIAGEVFTAEEAKHGIPPNNPNYFVAMRKVTPYVEVKV